LRRFLPTFLTAVIAGLAVAGLLFLTLVTDVGGAPGSGQKVFDAPGCLPKSYAGPGGTGHYLINRNCPRPRPVILRQASRAGEEWLVTWDGSRSFDPMGGRLVDFEWRLDDGHVRSGRTISIRYRRPGPHSVVLYVTNDSGLYGTEKQTVRLP
jgi:hypothetical protein